MAERPCYVCRDTRRPTLSVRFSLAFRLTWPLRRTLAHQTRVKSKENKKKKRLNSKPRRDRENFVLTEWRRNCRRKWCSKLFALKSSSAQSSRCLVDWIVSAPPLSLVYWLAFHCPQQFNLPDKTLPPLTTAVGHTTHETNQEFEINIYKRKGRGKIDGNNNNNNFLFLFNLPRPIYLSYSQILKAGWIIQRRRRRFDTFWISSRLKW